MVHSFIQGFRSAQQDTSPPPAAKTHILHTLFTSPHSAPCNHKATCLPRAPNLFYSVLQMIAKAVEAAAPSRERTAWYERKAHWEGTARRRQEARAAGGPSHSIVHAQGAGAVGAGATRWREATGARGTGGRNSGGAGSRRGGDGEDDDGGGDGYRLNKIQTVLAVAVMLVMAVFKLRSVR